VRLSGQVVGEQGLYGENSRVTRGAETGWWLGRAHQGRGIGTLMRQAACTLVLDQQGDAAPVLTRPPSPCWPPRPRPTIRRKQQAGRVSGDDGSVRVLRALATTSGYALSFLAVPDQLNSSACASLPPPALLRSCSPRAAACMCGRPGPEAASRSRCCTLPPRRPRAARSSAPSSTRSSCIWPCRKLA